MKKIGIVGYGYWGKNLVRNFNAIDSCDLVYVCELNAELAAKCQKMYPSVKVVNDYSILLADESIDGIVIATPVDTHYDMAKVALENNKHVLVEKPLTDSFAKAMELKELAATRNKTIMVDHTFLYTGAVRFLKERIDNDEYGQINYIDSIRINLGLFQHDINVLWDLAPHDISIVSYLLNKKPVAVSATGISHTNNDIENIAYLTLKYSDNLIVHFNCSWISPVKIRQMIIGGDKKMVLYNDMEPTEKIKVYDTGFKVMSDQEKNVFNADYRVGDLYVPKVPTTEALAVMAEDFIHSITTNSPPESNIDLGVDVVEILEKAEISIKNNSREIELSNSKVNN